MSRLIWVFAGRTGKAVGFVMQRLKNYIYILTRVYEKKKKAVERLEEQLTKLEVQATDKVGRV